MGLTRSLEKAKEAYEHHDIEASRKAHEAKLSKSTGPLEPPEQHQTSGQYIKSAVYGGLDGTITTFAVVAGVAGASLSSGVVLILGFANLIGDGISMAIGDYLSTRSQQEYHKAERNREQWEVDNYPEGEKLEMEQIYVSKGIDRKDSKKMVSILSKHEKAWVDVMMVEELGIIENDESPMKNAMVTFFSFLGFGLIPLLAYVLAGIIGIAKSNLFTYSVILTGLTLFLLGAMKVKITGKNWFKSGLEMLIVGSIAAGAAYLIGYLLQGLA